MNPPIALPPDLAAIIGSARWRREDSGESGGAVFRLEDGRGARYLKHGVGAVAEAITDEMVRLRWLDGRIAVPRLLHFARTGDAAWLLSSAMAGVADPYQDVAIMWDNLAEFGEAAQAGFLAGYGIADLDRDRLRFHRCLDEFF